MAIENDCHIVPKSSIVMTPNHEMRRNHAFAGLGTNEAFDINNYCYFRNVQEINKKRALMTENAIINKDLLEEASDCSTKGSWAIVRSGKPVAIIRNLDWTGYTAYHKVGTREYGTFYLGDGLKNQELTFQL